MLSMIINYLSLSGFISLTRYNKFVKDFSVQGTMAFLLVDMLMIMMQVSADSHFPNGLACMYLCYIRQRFMQKESFVPLSIHLN